MASRPRCAAACRAEGAAAYQVEQAEELRPEWFRGVETVGYLSRYIYKTALGQAALCASSLGTPAPAR